MAEPPQKLDAVFRGLCANCSATLDVMIFTSPGRSSKCKVHLVRAPPRARSRSPPPPALPGFECPPPSQEAAPAPGQEYPPPPSQELAPTCPGNPRDQPLLGPGGLLEQTPPPRDGADGLSAPPAELDQPLLGPGGLLEQTAPPPDGADGLPAPPAEALAAEVFDSCPESQVC